MVLDPITRLAFPVFTAPTLLNSWVNYGAPDQVAGYTLHLGLVRLRGTVKDGTVGVTIFTLPAGYRPAADERRATVANNAFGHLLIEADGDVILVAGSNGYVSLNCCFAPA